MESRREMAGSNAPMRDEIHERVTIEEYVPLRIDESDRIQAQAMKSLPTAKRVKIIEEVHGVSHPIEENPEFIAEKLAALDSEIIIQKTKAYELALKQNQSFVEDSDFRLMFLRCEGFVPNAAANKMMKYFKLKLKYFGEEKVTKNINFLDLSKDDIRSLESGAIQVLPEKDRSGRAVVVVLPRMWNHHEQAPENIVSTSALFVGIHSYCSYFFILDRCEHFTCWRCLLYKTLTCKNEALCTSTMTQNHNVGVWELPMLRWYQWLRSTRPLCH